PAVALVPREGRFREALRIEPERAAVRGENVDPTTAIPAGEALRGFLARYGGEWRFSHDARTSRFPMVQGSGIPLLPGRGNQLGQESLAGLDLTDGEITV